MTRRDFVGATAGAAMAHPPNTSFRKSICSIIFPAGMPPRERFQQTRNAGFEGIEIRLGEEVKLSSSADDVKRIGEEARKAGVAISALWVSEGLSDNPLNDPAAEVRAKGAEAIGKAIEFATYLNTPALLLVPGRLGNGAKFRIGYQDTWDRVTAELKKLLPQASRAKVILGPENVWNKFLVSPLEMRSFVDQFRSPWLQAFFDVGNVMQFGYPQDWILTLGRRTKNVHLKDYKLSARAEQGRFVDLLQGDVDWKEVMAALVKVGYQGFIGPEYGYDANNPGRLKQLSSLTDQILAMA
jgi:L-ribulose-5-phosphate 3-epimerase